MLKPVRVAAASVVLTAAGFVSIAADESYRGEAYIPVAGDRWTVGLGSTFWFDGTPVKKGDKIDVITALKLKLAHIDKDETVLNACVTAPISQKEKAILLSFAYQYGTKAACGSTIVKLVNQRQYAQACEQYARWTFVAGRNCRDPKNGCRGVAIRADERKAQCLAAQ